MGFFSPFYLFLNAVNIGLIFYNTSNIWTGFFSFIYSSRFYGELHMPQWNLVRSEFFKFKSVFFFVFTSMLVRYQFSNVAV